MRKELTLKNSRKLKKNKKKNEWNVKRMHGQFSRDMKASIRTTHG